MYDSEYLIKAVDLRKAYLSVKQLSKIKVTQFTDVLKPTSFNVKKGETLGLIGTNGAGKSTINGILSMSTKRSYGDVLL